MGTPTSGRILTLLQEVVNLVEENNIQPTSTTAPRPPVSTPTTSSPISVLAELRNRFQPYPGVSPQRFRVSGRAAGRRSLAATPRTWSNRFFCLGGPTMTKTPDGPQRVTLMEGDLGEKIVTIDVNGTTEEMREKIMEIYPRLQGIHFELMRCMGTGGYHKPLVRISSTDPVPNVAYLKVSRITTIWIRPLVDLITMDDETEMQDPVIVPPSPAASLQDNYSWGVDSATTSTITTSAAPDEEEVSTMETFQSQVMQLNPGVQVVRVFRDGFFERLYGVYKDPSLNLLKELRVDFLGEAGADYGALKREYFWKGFIAFINEKLDGRVLFEGEKGYLIPAADSKLLRSGIFRFVGKFIVHAAIHCGIGFLGLSEAVAEYITTEDVSSDTPFSISINDIPDPDHKNALQSVRQILYNISLQLTRLQSGATLTHDEAVQVQELALNSDFLDTVTPINAEEAMIQILYHQVIERRKPYLDSMKEAMKSTGLLQFINKYPYLRSGIFPRMKDVQYPLAVVLDRIQYKGSETVINHVKSYLESLHEDKIPVLLKAWTGWSIIPETPLKITVDKDVEFNASTCFEEIFVPEDCSKEDVRSWFDLLLENPEGFGIV